MTESDYCREIERYLCQKNDGHLIRIVGPSFELVSRWADDGIPIKIAFKGIDRYFERYYRKGPRRRPVRIDFCEADVLDVFDEWRRAVGLSRHVVATSSQSGPQHEADRPRKRTGSLAAHLERVVTRLTNARATGTLSAAADTLIDRLAGELDAARASAQGLRGAARQMLLNRLANDDVLMLQLAHGALKESERRWLDGEADEELARFRGSMPPDAFAKAREAAINRLLRDRFNLPTIAFD